MIKKEVNIFIPCLADQLSANVAFDLIEVIKKLGFTPIYNDRQTCCGKLLFDNGNWNEAKKVGEKFLDDFKGTNFVVGCSSSCVQYIKTKAEKLFYNTSNHNTYKSLSQRIMDITEFVHYVLPNCDLNAVFNHKVFMQGCCTAKEINTEMRLCLQSVKNLQIVNNKDLDTCCGAGALLELYNKPISDELAKRVIDRAISLQAEYIVSSDIACLLRFKSFIEKNNIDLKAIHIVSVLNSVD